MRGEVSASAPRPMSKLFFHTKEPTVTGCIFWGLGFRDLKMVHLTIPIT